MVRGESQQSLINYKISAETSKKLESPYRSIKSNSKNQHRRFTSSFKKLNVEEQNLQGALAENIEGDFIDKAVIQITSGVNQVESIKPRHRNPSESMFADITVGDHSRSQVKVPRTVTLTPASGIKGSSPLLHPNTSPSSRIQMMSEQQASNNYELSTKDRKSVMTTPGATDLRSFSHRSGDG